MTAEQKVEVVEQEPKVVEEEKVEGLKWGKGIPNEFDPFEYKILNPEDFSIENLVFKGKVFANVQVTEDITVTYRSLTTNELQELERETLSSDSENLRYSYNELNLRPTIMAMHSMTFRDKTTIFAETHEDKDKEIREISYAVMDEIVRAYTWFSLRVALLVRKSDLKN